MQYILIPKWMQLLADLAVKDRWINGSNQELMHPVIFYNIAPRLFNMNLLQVRTLKNDKRIKEYSLTIEGWLYGQILRKLQEKVSE